MSLLDTTREAVKPVDTSRAPEIQAHLDDLTKPPGSLGVLEEIALRYCLIRGTTTPAVPKKKIFTFAGDHGVVDEGVSAFPKEVTPQMVRNMLAGGAAVCVLAKHAGADVAVVDMGVADPLDDAPGLLRHKIADGTRNMAHGPAMTEDETRRAVEVGITLAQQAIDDGVELLATGEMGIGNTTPSSALFAALLPCEVDEITGRGTGVDDTGRKHKVAVIRRALEVNTAHLSDPFTALAAVGGLEIAGITGLILGGAARGVPVVVDGFISSAAALVACAMCEPVRDYLFFSHKSQEQGHAVFLDKFSARPILDLDMRLGEGTGAAVAMTVIDAAIKIYNDMATFSSAGVSNA